METIYVITNESNNNTATVSIGPDNCDIGAGTSKMYTIMSNIINRLKFYTFGSPVMCIDIDNKIV